MSERDDVLQSAYQRLTQEASRSEPAPDTAPEILQQLADGTYLGTDRDTLIDRALAHEATAREFAFFLDARGASPPRATAARWRPWALAASILFVVASGIRWLGSDTSDEPMRSSDAAFTVILPDEGTAVDTSTVFAWRPVPDASRYLVEVVREDGTAVATVTTADTTAIFRPSAPLLSGERLSWWVTATLADGTTRRSAPALVRAR